MAYRETGTVSNTVEGLLRWAPSSADINLENTRYTFEEQARAAFEKNMTEAKSTLTKIREILPGDNIHTEDQLEVRGKDGADESDDGVKAGEKNTPKLNHIVAEAHMLLILVDTIFSKPLLNDCILYAHLWTYVSRSLIPSINEFLNNLTNNPANTKDPDYHNAFVTYNNIVTKRIPEELKKYNRKKAGVQ